MHAQRQATPICGLSCNGHRLAFLGLSRWKAGKPDGLRQRGQRNPVGQHSLARASTATQKLKAFARVFRSLELENSGSESPFWNAMALQPGIGVVSVYHTWGGLRRSLRSEPRNHVQLCGACARAERFLIDKTS